MSDHPCRQHQPGRHIDACLTGACGFCGVPLDSVASGECRNCLRIVCEACDACFEEPELAPLGELLSVPAAPGQERTKEKNQQATGGAKWSWYAVGWSQEKFDRWYRNRFVQTDAGYRVELGPICRPCSTTSALRPPLNQ